MTSADTQGNLVRRLYPIIATVVACIAIVSLTVVSGCGSVHNQDEVSMGKARRQEKDGAFTGDFVDIDDQEAMEAWARRMCRGLRLEQAAATLGTDATVPSVAHALMDRQVENEHIREAILKVCEEELIEANGPNTGSP